MSEQQAERSALLDVEHVTCGYPRVAVLDDVSFRLQSGSIVAVLGPNGAGKTTLLRALAGLIPVRAGTITLRGTVLNGVPAHRRPRLGVAHVAEGRRLFGDMTVKENLVCGGYVHRGRQKLLAEQFDRVLDLFPALKEKSSQKAAELSGGQQQMLAIGRALMCRPRVLLLDEPTSGLAPIVVEQLGAALRTLRAEGVGILLVEQAIAFAAGLADNVHMLAGGHLAASQDHLDLASSEREDLWHAYLGIRTT